MGSCQSTSKNNVVEKKEDIKEYIDVNEKREDFDREIAKEEKGEICKDINEEIKEKEEVDEVDGKKKKIIIFNGAPGSGKDTQCSLIEKKYNFKILTSSELLKKYLEENKEKLHEDSSNENKLTDEEKSDLEIIEKCINDGSLVPDDTVKRVFFINLNNYINNVEFDGIIINGYPRTYDQALLFKNNNIKVNSLINITATKECLLERINRRIVDPVTNINYDEKIIELIKKKRGGEELTEEEEKIVSQNEGYNNLNDEDINRLIKRKDDEQNVFDKRFNLYKENEEEILSVFSDVRKDINGEKPINDVFDEISEIIDDIIKN